MVSSPLNAIEMIASCFSDCKTRMVSYEFIAVPQIPGFYNQKSPFDYDYVLL